MRLTRRHALVALGSVGAGGIVGAAGVLGGADSPRAGGGGPELDGGAKSDDGRDALDEALLSTLVAAAEVLYPVEVEGHRAFVETYVVGRLRGREDYRAGLAATVADLDATARDWTGDPFATLHRDARDRLLRDLGVDVADGDPAGPMTDRVRYYVVEDLLYAFYASPVGGRLVGIENPIGYPGGTESYRRSSMPDAGTASRPGNGLDSTARERDGTDPTVRDGVEDGAGVSTPGDDDG